MRDCMLTHWPFAASAPLPGIHWVHGSLLAALIRHLGSVSIFEKFLVIGYTNRLEGNVDKPNVRQSTDLKGHTASIEKVAFNPVKELELCSVSADGTARFWDVKTKALLNEVKGLGETFTLAWAPNGEHVVVGNKVCPIVTVVYEGVRLHCSTGR